MLFVVVIPTYEYEQEILYGVVREEPSEIYDSEPAAKMIANRPAARVNPTGKNKIPPIPPRTTAPRGPIVLRSGKMIKDDVPLERLLEELLKRLQIFNAVWCEDKDRHFYQVIFLRDAGDQTENCLHALKEVGVGTRLNSIVSVSPCNVYQSADDALHDYFDEIEDETDKKAWKGFVDSVKSKLTVAQVVDGVRSSADLTFDYLLLILTADMIAAVGLVENNSVNIVAAMLVSPLMSPILAITFGFVISDRKLQLTGLKSEFAGIGTSLVFGFVFGLLVGTTEHPWGYGDWPTEEMKGRGTARSLWVGILWALPSGTGVALALLQGSAGPLIGVAISASLLPPIVNCGMFWGLTCMKIHYGSKMKIPHLKGEAFNGTTAYVPMYSEYLPYELVSMGCISFCLFLVNIVCIFITAVCVLKIKEVAAPYTSSVDLRRFWAEDIRVARNFNRASAMDKRASRGGGGKEYQPDLSRVKEEEVSEALGAAVKEAMNDDTFRKVKRCSYSPAGPDMINQLLNLAAAAKPKEGGPTSSSGNNDKPGGVNVQDPAVLGQLVSALLGQTGQTSSPQQAFNRMSLRRRGSASIVKTRNDPARSSWMLAQNQGASGHQAGLPTITEGNSRATRRLSLSERALNAPVVRNLLQTLSNVPQKLSIGSDSAPASRRVSSRRDSESSTSATNPLI